MKNDARSTRPKRTKVWTDDARRRLSKTMKHKHQVKQAERAKPQNEPELTPEEIAEIEAEHREKEKAAADFANELRLLTCEKRPVDPAAEALFVAAGITDPEAMREVATWVFMACARNDHDEVEQMIRLEVRNQLEEEYNDE
jgi:hypothetical protein